MKTLIERVQDLIDATGWDVDHIAKVAGVSASAVYQWLGKGTKTIHSIGKIEAAIRLERASGFSALWLAKGQGPKMVAAQPAAAINVRAVLQFHREFLATLSPLDQTLAQTAFKHFLDHPQDMEAVCKTLEDLMSRRGGLGGMSPSSESASLKAA